MNDDEPIDVETLGWDTHRPPEGFAEQVVDRFVDAPAEQRPRRATWGLAAAAVALAAAVMLWLVVPTGGATRDSLTTDVLRTVSLHDRAVAVARAGTTMRWEVEADGTTRVEQDAGRVFYRVDHGKSFEVQTRAGVVRVTGTSFEVEVMNRSSIKGGVLGAALAGAVVVSVYEGSVVLANDKGEVALGPGERAAARDGSAPSRWDDDGGSGSPAELAGLAEAKVAAGVDPIETVRMQARQLERLRAEKNAADDEVDKLREQVQALGGSVDPTSPEAIQARAKSCAQQSRNGSCPFLEPDEATLVEMAKCGTVKIDHPSWLDDFDPPESGHYAGSLGVTDPKEAAAIQAAAERHHAAFTKEMRDIYLKLGGDPELATESSPSTLQAFIEDQLDRELMADLQRKIAEERAGLREPPGPDAELSIEERFWRMRAEMGNDFEEHVARELGPERAHELRSLHDGWPGSTSVHSSDCRE